VAASRDIHHPQIVKAGDKLVAIFPNSNDQRVVSRLIDPEGSRTDSFSRFRG
jgi:hypothetical protein